MRSINLVFIGVIILRRLRVLILFLEGKFLEVEVIDSEDSYK